MPARITPLYVNSGYMAKRVAVIANNLLLRRKIDAAGYMALTGTYPPGIDPEEFGEDAGAGGAPAAGGGKTGAPAKTITPATGDQGAKRSMF
jgi:hypothetical protein